jgi:hypothetical protein
MKAWPYRLYLFGLLAVATLQGLPLHADALMNAQPASTEISGDYRYTFRESEAIGDAKEHACREALRLAISAFPAVREHTTSPVDPAFSGDLVLLLASQHVTNVQILEQTQKGRTIYCKVRGNLQPDTVAQIVRAQLRITGPEGGLDRNRVLQIMDIEDREGTVVVTYKALRRLDWTSTAYDGSLQGLADVMVDFFDSEGTLIRTHRHPARKTLAGDDVMYPGQVSVFKAPRPLQTKSYRVWLVK